MTRLARATAIAVALGASASAALAADVVPVLAVTVSARGIQPGELVVLTVATPDAVSEVRVTAFKRAAPVFRVRVGLWRALVGIDLEQQPGHYDADVEATTPTSVLRQRQPLDVGPKRFVTRTLKVEPDYVNPPPDALARAARESEFLRSIYANTMTARLWTIPFVRPVPGPSNSAFGSRSIYNGERRSPHAGADFLSGAGTPVLAPSAGRVVAARDLFFTGNTIVIDHGLGLYSLLAHLSKLDVSEGDSVAAGQVVGLVGATGRVTGPHLHWGLMVAGARVDPLSALALLTDDR